MSTDIIILGFSLDKTTVLNMCGLFGGLFPFFYDLLNRQKQEKSEKIELNREFFLIKAILIPLIALVFTAFAVGFETISTWLAAIYLGASLPILIQKYIESSNKTVKQLDVNQ